MADRPASSASRTRGLNRLVGWSQHPTILLAMMGQSFINMLGTGIVSPVLPLYARSFGVSAAAVGMLISAFGIARIPINVPAGAFAENRGRKPLLVVAPLIMSVAALFTGLAGQFGQMVALRLVQGVGSAIQMTAAMIVMADISTPADRGRTMSLYQGALLLGTSVGPMIGGFIGEHLGFRTPFFVYSALTLCSAAWAYFAVAETRGMAHAAQGAAPGHARSSAHGGISWRNAVRLLGNRNFALVSLCTLMVFFTRTGSQNTVLSLFGQDRLGLGPAKVGYGFTLIALLNFLTINVSGVLCDRLGRKVAIVPSGILAALALVTFTLGHTYWHFLGSCALLGIGLGVGGPAPAAYVSDLDLPGGRGLTMGVYRTVGDLGMSVAPVLLGWLSDRVGYDAALLTNAVLFLLVATAFGLFATETRPRARPGVCPAPGD